MSAPEKTSYQADVIIVGARVAGAGLAAMLGDRGLRVLLLDKGDLPAPAVSTHFFGPIVLGTAERLGVLDEVLALGAPPLRHWHLEIAGMHYGGPMLIPPPHGYNICVRRELFDAVLLRRAVSTGRVTVLTRSPVRGVIEEDGKIVGVTGAGWIARAPVVVGADGDNSTLARLVGAPTEYDGGVQRCSAHAYWRDVVPLPEPSLELWYDGEDVIQFGPCDSGLWVLLISSPRASFDRIRTDGADGYRRRLDAIPAMRSRLRSAEMVSPVYTLGELRNQVRTAAGPGWFLAGDALCRRDPLFGSGMADALRAATTLAPLIEDLVAGKLTSADASTRYGEHVRTTVTNPLRDNLAALDLTGPLPDQLAWIRGLFGHPALALDLCHYAADLVGALPQERREFWTSMALHAAGLDGLPDPAQPRTVSDLVPVSASGETR